jgi:hypothetical protein
MNFLFIGNMRLGTDSISRVEVIYGFRGREFTKKWTKL